MRTRSDHLPLSNKQKFSIKRLLFYHIQLCISIIGSFNSKEGGPRGSMFCFRDGKKGGASVTSSLAAKIACVFIQKKAIDSYTQKHSMYPWDTTWHWIMMMDFNMHLWRFFFVMYPIYICIYRDQRYMDHHSVSFWCTFVYKHTISIMLNSIRPSVLWECVAIVTADSYESEKYDWL